MPLYAGIAIIALVWTIGRIRSRTLQSFVYSLPIPITIQTLSTQTQINSNHLMGICTLFIFFGLIAYLHRYRIPTVITVPAGLAAYLLVATAIKQFPPPSFAITAAVVFVGWLIYAVISVRQNLPDIPAPKRISSDKYPRWLSELTRILILSASTFLMVVLGGFFGAFSATFPYTGLLLAFDMRGDVGAFLRKFVLATVNLFVFFTVVFIAQDHLELWLSVVIGWGVFLITSGIAALVRLGRKRRLRLFSGPLWPERRLSEN